MSENINPKELPHELLMRKYSLTMDMLGTHAKQLKKDLDRTLHLVINKSKNGVVRLTPTTREKIEAYDRYICEGIFEYLDEKDVISEQQADNLEQQMDNKRDDVVEKMENMNEASTQRTTNSTSENPNQESSEEDKEEGGDIKVGSFWDWS